MPTKRIRGRSHRRGGSPGMAASLANGRVRGMTTTDERTTCAVIGAGLGGVAVCANLGLAGYRMRLTDLNDARLTELRARGGIDVEGLVQGFAPLERVT